MNNDEMSADIANEIEGRFERCRKIINEIKHTEQLRWRAIAGPWLDQMLCTPGDAESYLRNSDPQLRLVALQILTYYWRDYERIALNCEKLVFCDTNREVRLTALSSLGVCYMNSSDSKIGQILAQLVYKDQEPDELRTVAYFALLSVAGLSDSNAEECIKTSRLLRFPNEIDWSIVDRFAFRK